MITILLKKIVALLKSISEKEFSPQTEDMTNTITIDETYIDTAQSTIKVLKCGNIINIMFNPLFSKNGVVAPNDHVLISGLPKPKFSTGVNVTRFLSSSAYDNRFEINTNGEFKNPKSFPNNSPYYGEVTYIIDNEES